MPLPTTTAARLRQSARDLFLQQGYVTTTTKQLAERAGVTERTLFNTYTSKAELLRAAVIEVVTGSSGADNATARADFRRAFTARTPQRKVALFADAVAQLHAEVAPLAAICRQAAHIDPAAAEFWAWGIAQSRRDCEEYLKVLRPSNTASRAFARLVDETAMLTSHEVYWQLAVGSGWSDNTYRKWLRRQLSWVLLQPELTN